MSVEPNGKGSGGVHPKNAFEGVGASPFKKTVALEGAVRSSRIVFDYALSQDDADIGYGFSFGTATERGAATRRWGVAVAASLAPG